MRRSPCMESALTCPSCRQWRSEVSLSLSLSHSIPLSRSFFRTRREKLQVEGGGGVSPRVSPVELARPGPRAEAFGTRPCWPHYCVNWLSTPRAASLPRREDESRRGGPTLLGLALSASEPGDFRPVRPPGRVRETHRKWPFELHLTSYIPILERRPTVILSWVGFWFWGAGRANIRSVKTVLLVFSGRRGLRPLRQDGGGAFRQLACDQLVVHVKVFHSCQVFGKEMVL